MDEEEDRKVTKFPGEKERRERLILRAANDGAPVREPVLNLPPAIKALSLVLILVYLVQRLLPLLIGAPAADDLLYALGLVPARYTGGQPFGAAAVISPVTHMFLHGGWMHLGVNVLSLMAFGAGVEKWMGGKKMLLIYFICGIAGAFLQVALSPHSDNPMIGASGAISGLFGALLVQMNDRGVLQSNGRNPLVIFAGVWVLTSLFFGVFGVPGAEGAISWATHIGGFGAGMALARPVGRLKL